MNASGATWEGKGVSLGQIEAQLHRLWSAADGVWEGDGRHPDIRASVLNLIVYAINEACCHRAVQAIEQLSGTHPSRAIIIMPGEGHADPTLDARVTIKSHGAYAEYGQVCSEQLILLMHGHATKRVSSIVIPLLAPDLPVFLWWPGETPFHHHLFHELRAAVDRFIVDSSDFGQPATDLVNLAQEVRLVGHECAFSDFNWARLAPWRETIAQFFDPPRFRPYLNRLTSVRIDCSADSTTAEPGWDLPRGLLLTGWLAATLQLHPGPRQEAGPNRYAFSLVNATHDVTVEVHLSSHDAGDSALRIQAAGAGSDPGAEFSLDIDRSSGQVVATTSVEGEDAVLHRTRIAERAEGQLLFQELELFHRDEPYEKSLLAASRLLDPRYHRTPVKGSLVV